MEALTISVARCVALCGGCLPFLLPRALGHRPLEVFLPGMPRLWCARKECVEVEILQWIFLSSWIQILLLLRYALLWHDATMHQRLVHCLWDLRRSRILKCYMSASSIIVQYVVSSKDQ